MAPGPIAACYPILAFTAPDLGSKLPELTSGTVIGITVAITGNVLISLALNLQKLAHKRGEAERVKLREQVRAEASQRASPSNGESEQQTELPPAVLVVQQNYGSTSHLSTPKKTLVSRLFPSKRQHPTSERTTLLPVDVIPEEEIVNQSTHHRKPEDDEDDLETGNESDYLKSKLWWLGFTLMNVGEMGNFISYAWAPASVVAPLGTFALMANCVFAPLMLHERFRKRDILGIFIAVVGAVTVVLASNASDTRLDPDALLAALSRLSFLIYTGAYIIGIFVLSILSESKVGKQSVFVDVGLCALFGGFTVLSTKAVSTLLTMEWLEMFTKWITYPTIAVLILTGVGQIRYLNRALMRFDGKVVIPIQFVLFTISAIVGSAVLYGDFEKATFHQLVTFLYGCAATFTGVFIIAWEPQREPARQEVVSTEGEDQDTDVSESEDESPHPGTPSRKKRPALILPNGFLEEHELLHKPSAVSIMALSPARPLLMVHTPPREIPDRLRDIERDPHTGSLVGSQRRRAISYIGEDSRSQNGRSHSLIRNARYSVANPSFNPWSSTNGSVSSSPEQQR
ncbi:DUF803 domain membrane protein [Mycena indigotica]|uniref:DUF803 domain membrane protein n=1 Tax=Mycena indigotica TaxID=2126181 RepID=A0A8H6SNC2_9AGAR|nr:DUF803 domain membrane protein [Mycena indigotica]KAF7301407.1 DUF803 domain membrane protein [Mycena indigotica]